MRRAHALWFAFGLALVGVVGLILIGVWVALDSDRREVDRFGAVGGGILGALALLVQTGPRFWLDIRGDARAANADNIATFRERNELNEKISELESEEPFKEVSNRIRQLADLKEHRGYLDSVLSQR